MSKKGQSSIEFIILIGALMFATISILLILESSVSDKTKEKTNLEFKENARNIQNEITLANSATNGYQREFELPARLGSMNYSISLTNSFIYIESEDKKYALALPVYNVTGNIIKGKNIIRKLNDIVYLN